MAQPREHSDHTDELAAVTRLQAAVDLLCLGLYAWDPQTNALEWDAQMRAIWGLPPDAHVDHGVWHERIHPEDVARVNTAVASCRDPNGDGLYDIEYRINGPCSTSDDASSSH